MRAGLTVLVWLVVLLLVVPILFCVAGIFIPVISRAVGTPQASVYTIGGQYGSGQPLAASSPRVSLAILPVMLVGIAGVLLVVGVLSALLRRQPVGRRGRRGEELELDETRMMQEIYRSLGRMEERIEALETLLLDRSMQPGTSRPESRPGIGRGV